VGLSLHLPRPMAQMVVRTIHHLGGTIATIEASTHCVISSGLDELAFQRDPSLRQYLRRCQAAGLVVVETTWIEEVAKLPAGWSWTDPHRDRSACASHNGAARSC